MNRSPDTELRDAVWAGNLDAVRSLLDQGLDIDKQYSYGSGRTLLMVAAEAGHTSMCELLLKRGANPNLKDLNGSNAIQYAKSAEQVELLLRHRLELLPVIPVEWLSKRVDIETLRAELEEHWDVDSFVAPMLPGDEIWEFDNSDYNPGLADRRGFAIVKNGIPIRSLLVS